MKSTNNNIPHTIIMSAIKRIFLIALLLVSSKLFAQVKSSNNNTANAGFNSTGYGAASVSFSKINKKNALFVGAYGGWLINDKLTIGAGGFALVSRHKGTGTNLETNKQNELRMGYGGLMLEYHFSPDNTVHITANTLLGGGEVSNGYQSSNSGAGSKRWTNLESSPIYVIQPSLNVEVNVNNWLCISAGLGYRYIMGSTITGLSNRNMSAPTANLAFKFGGF